MVDPKTNFMLLMLLLDLNPPRLAQEIGTDITLISRWRTGNRRLIPGRHWIDKVSETFWRIDSERETSVIMPVICALYPTRPASTREQQLTLIADFLTCPGQMQYMYRIRRYQLLSPILPDMLANPEAIGSEQPVMGENYKGKQRLIASIMTFFDVVDSVESPRRIICVAQDGLNLLFDIDTTFALKVLGKLGELFEKGHTLALIVGCDYRAVADEYLLERFTLYQLQGYITIHRTTAPDEFDMFNKSSMLWSTQQEAFLRVSFPEGESHQINVNLLRAELPVRKIYYASLLLLKRTPECARNQILSSPSDYLDGRQNMRYTSVYVIARLPHFGMLGQQECRRAMTLKEHEYIGFAQRLSPLAMTLKDYPRSASVRHIYSIDDIVKALERQHHDVREMSVFLGRPVTFQRASLKLVLEKMLHQLKTNNRYELALVDRPTFSKLGGKHYVGMPGYLLSFGLDRDDIGSTDLEFIQSAMRFCDAQWERIPVNMKNRETMIKALESLLM